MYVIKNTHILLNCATVSCSVKRFHIGTLFSEQERTGGGGQNLFIVCAYLRRLTTANHIKYYINVKYKYS